MSVSFLKLTTYDYDFLPDPRGAGLPQAFQILSLCPSLRPSVRLSIRPYVRPYVHPYMPIAGGIEPFIRTSQESWCLPYARFLFPLFLQHFVVFAQFSKIVLSNLLFLSKVFVTLVLIPRHFFLLNFNEISLKKKESKFAIIFFFCHIYIYLLAIFTLKKQS